MNKHLPNRAGRAENNGEGSYRHEQAPQGGSHKRLAAIISVIAVGVLVVVGPVAVVIRPQQALVTSARYPAIDHIPCQSGDPNGIHVHAHVTIYISGERIPIPKDIGIAPDGSCLFWLHTHDASGNIHIEAPRGSSFTLGDFLDIWSFQFQQLGYPKRLSDPAEWRAYVAGKRVTSDMRSISLDSHTLITLTYNSPGVIPDTSYPWGDF